jgi:phosphate acetyltransferase
LISCTLESICFVWREIDLAHALGIAEPRVAILFAIETVNPKITSTVDAAALCKMAERGQIMGAILDGPLAFDTAVSTEAALTKNIRSPVAGEADILIAPDLDAANMLAKGAWLSGRSTAGRNSYGRKSADYPHQPCRLGRITGCIVRNRIGSS